MAGTATGAKSYMEDMPTDAMCGDLFDHIDDLLDFPNDDDTGFMVMGGMTTETIPYTQGGGPLPLPPTPSFPPPPLPSPPKVEYDDGLVVGGGGLMTNASPGNDDTDTAAFNRKGDQLFDDLDIADLEWLSNFMDDSADSFSLDFPTADIGSSSSNDIKEQSLFRTPSPVSVLEPSSLSSGGGASSSSSSFSYSGGNGGGSDNGRALQVTFKSPDPISAVPARARSKRPRPATFFPRPHVTIPFLPPSSDCPSLLPPPSEPESFGESSTPPATNKAKKKKKSPPAAAGVGREEAVPPAVRKCMHCEIQKTPQWRAGPMGPKTLCNACGVRYKSGRLFPEYRPAASPTFVPSLHSNSHKKVVEMRIKSIQTATPGMPSPETCDLLEYIRRRE